MLSKRISRREMMKALGALGLGAALSACSPAAEEATPAAQDAPAEPAAPEKVKIRLSGWGNTEEITLYENIAKAHMEEDPSLEIEVIGLPFSDYETKLFTWIASGDPPDCLRTGTQFFPTLWADGALLDLTPYFDEMPELLDDELYFTELYDIYQMEDRLYGTILGPTVMIGYYNKTIFEQAGVEPPNAEWTYDDYAQVAKELTQGEGVNKIWGSTNYYGRLQWQSQLWARGGEIFDKVRNPTKCLLDSDEMVETVQWFHDMVYVHRAAPTDADASALEGGWNSGRVAMELGGSWAINARRKIEAFEWDLFHFPREKVQATCHLAGAVVLSKDGKHHDQAWAHAAFYESDRAQKMFAEDGLNTPMMRKWAESETFLKLEGAPEHHVIRVDAMEYSRNRDFYFEKWREVQTKVWAPEMEKLMLDQQTAEETVKNMAEGTQALLDA